MPRDPKPHTGMLMIDSDFVMKFLDTPTGRQLFCAQLPVYLEDAYNFVNGIWNQTGAVPEQPIFAMINIDRGAFQVTLARLLERFEKEKVH